DYQRFLAHEWPQCYLSICDIHCTRAFLKEKTHVHVLRPGGEQRGRYSAIAAALDLEFAGFIGVPTSGFSRAGESYSGDLRRSLLSIDPDACAERMAPWSNWALHSPGDTVIPFADGQALYQVLPEPKSFFPFNGTHGLNEEADAWIPGECAQIYGPAR
ncbi:MAG TPA: alpha/beta hydrolase, partial [Methanolinea sp.]|nr:alpha/beta hydrolase [Methanolinea sp.]